MKSQAHAEIALLMNALALSAHKHRNQRAIVHAARMFYRLYGDVFRSLPLPVARRPIEEAIA